MDGIDIFADSPDQQTQVPDSPALKEVSALVSQWDKDGDEIEKAELYIRVRKERRRQIEEETLPAAMSEAGITTFKTATGRSVVIDEVVRGNIPAISSVEKAKGTEKAALMSRRTTAIDYVRSHWPGLIKTELSVSLGKDQTELADRIAEVIRKDFELDPTIDETIHPASLNSHFKELKSDGRLGEIPVEPFSLYVGPIAKIK